MNKEERIQKETERLAAMSRFELECSGGADFIFGIDEAGRGPLCGPVVAACCILPPFCDILYLNDSKKLSEKKREVLYDEIREKAVAFGLGRVDAARIDQINILNATFEAMRDAFNACLDMYRERAVAEKPALSEGFSMDGLDELPGMSDSIVLVDGNRTVPGIYFRQKAIVSGDAECPSISAASILAKVTRDRILIEYDKIYPEYGFRRHKGYGTKEHMEALKKYGPLDIHRKSFLKGIL